MRGRGVPVLVMGMPFDPKNRPPADHLSHARNFTEDGSSGGVVWQPSYLSDRALKDLGTLVRIDYLLAGAGDRLTEAARHLSAGDREQARAILRNQQSALQQRVRACLEAAYGIRPDNDSCIGVAVPADERLVSLDGTFQPQMPIGADMKSAVSALLDRLFEHRFPAHPVFDEEIRDAALRRMLERVQEAAGEPNQRTLISDHSDRRHLGAIAVPLKLGIMSQTHLQLINYWAEHFARQHARSAGAPFTVARLREWIDLPQRMGLPLKVQNLVILAFAAQADRMLMRNNVPMQGSLDRIEDTAEVKEVLLPSEISWAKARERSQSLFGIVPPEVRKGANVRQLAEDLKTVATEKRARLGELQRALQPRTEELGIPLTASRLTTLRSAQSLTAELVAATDAVVTINALADADLAVSEAAVARLLASVNAVASAVSSASWDVIHGAIALADHRRAAATGLRDKLVEALEADEYVVPLKPVLDDIQQRATRLLTDTSANRGTTTTAATSQTSQSQSVRPATISLSEPILASGQQAPQILDEGSLTELDVEEAATALDRLRERIVSTPRSRLTISWRLTLPTRGE